jgi:hypothetical protein
MRDTEVLRIFARALLIAAPDAGELRVLCVLESGREATLSMMAEAENTVADHSIHASLLTLSEP